MPIPFVHPSSILIAGPSKSGKTVFVRRLIEEKMLSPMPSRIVLVFSEWQPEYNMLQKLQPKTEFIKGPMPNELYDSFSAQEPSLLVLDDQMTREAYGKTDQVEKYFVQGSHHKNLSVIFILQNLFEKGRGIRTSSLNSNYLVLYKNPRDKGQVATLGRQMYPNKWRSFVAALDKATEAPHSYLLIDLTQDTPEEFRLRGNIFTSDEATSTDVYITT